ncbi:MAG: copper chaperone PCu(A)C [Betaproteobacteria bacterium]|nr:copper chaperone PCu(A)C [Betaproteobacteria bacterium]
MHSFSSRLSTKIFFLALFTSSVAFAGDIQVIDPSVRQPPANAPTTGAFMTLKNTGNRDIKLIKAESPVAKNVELHTNVNEDGMMKMRQVANIEIKAKGETLLKPGSYHIMLIGLTQPLAEGDKIPMTLSFDDGSKEEISAPVKAPTTSMPSHPMSH